MRCSFCFFLTLLLLYICFILCSCRILGQITWWFRTKCQAVTYFTENQWSEIVVKMYCIWKFLRLPWLFGLLVFPFYCHILSFKHAQLTAFTIKVHDYTLRRPQGVSKLNLGNTFNRSNYFSLQIEISGPSISLIFNINYFGWYTLKKLSGTTIIFFPFTSKSFCLL